MIVSSTAVVLGFDSYRFASAMRKTEKDGKAWTFEAFTIEEDCKTVKRQKQAEVKFFQEWKVEQPLLGKVKTLFDEKDLSERQRLIPDSLYQEFLDAISSLNRLANYLRAKNEA